jgi:hypothetical protein
MNSVEENQASELALKRYDAILKYYIYENTIYWPRCQFFVVGNAALFGFVASKLMTNDLLFHPRVFALACIGGMALSILWYRSLVSAEYWTSRWEGICVQLEAAAFGNIEIFRGCRPEKHFSTKGGARYGAILFLVLWAAAFVFVIVQHWPEPL